MLVKMNETKTGAVDGINFKTFEAGKVYNSNEIGRPFNGWLKQGCLSEHKEPKQEKNVIPTVEEKQERTRKKRKKGAE